MTTTQAIARVLFILRGALGTGETPANSNNNYIVEWYNENVERIGRGPWCQMTVTWAFWVAGFKAVLKGRAYTVWAAQDFINRYAGGTWHYGTAGMRAGDIVYYDWTARKGNVSYVDHVGTVEKVNGDGTFAALEGNTSNNTLRRMIRDSKFVVGYGRVDWSQVSTTTPPASSIPNLPKLSKKVDRAVTKKIQADLEVAADGQWGRTTDEWFLRMRAAARAHVGYPRNVKKPFYTGLVQMVIDTTPDKVWGPNSQRALVAWVKDFQRDIGVTADGQWGPGTDAKAMSIRANNRNQF